MKIGINGSFIRKQDSGIGQVCANFLRVLREELEKEKTVFGEVEFVVYLEKEAAFEGIDNFKKCIIDSFYKRDDLVRKILWEKILLPRQVEKDRCDVLFSLYQSPTVLKNTKHVMLVHDTVWKIFPQYLNNLRKKLYYSLVGKGIQSADEIITISQNSKNDIVKFFQTKDDSISVIPIDCDRIFHKKIPEKEKTEILNKFKLKEEEYIFYVGGFDVRKNVDALLRAYGILYTRHNQKMEIPRLILAGSFHSNLIPLVVDVPGIAEEVMRKNGIPRGYIESIGFVPQKELPAIYAGAKLFCYPSLYEGFGLPVLEAMSVGCPVVASNVSSIPEIADESEIVLVDPENDEKIAEGMLEFIISNELAKERVQNAKNKAKKFGWKKFTKKTMKLLTKA
ncbi:glycosyltransferase family 4 protein [bacterium]|jgi:glycosyltransferase involved in cell wall biosynthesis|nr:glycosyltransferase family 4 protein [bacterium]MBT4251065.1 glycosyltransferase family 4 protein [bacterium]MBT4597970.1 glycosyltransferase family 4 protein [bacterium]MBT6753461.1 glycosyltransferase family 4 protein [bacterium]MBT7038012.1 glycosyltransferase family 4 protein [bacterium]